MLILINTEENRIELLNIQEFEEFMRVSFLLGWSCLYEQQQFQKHIQMDIGKYQRIE